MPSVCGRGVSQLEMAFCDIHVCELGKELGKAQAPFLFCACPEASALLQETSWRDMTVFN